MQLKGRTQAVVYYDSQDDLLFNLFAICTAVSHLLFHGMLKLFS